MTGKAGIAIATSGPGVSNLVTGLATANSEGDPMVALGGRRRCCRPTEVSSPDDGFGGRLPTGNQVCG
jgi:thiamine pyrophosphate-dependent acetolactate synthase large subunit-like protein